jgi:hypothetical protein
MGEAKRRGTPEERRAAARERERAAWADEMVMDVAAIFDAADRRVTAEEHATSRTLPPDEHAQRVVLLASLACQRAVASSAFDEPEFEDPEDDEDEDADEAESDEGDDPTPPPCGTRPSLVRKPPPEGTGDPGVSAET